jgi:hypothetical protein
LVASELSAEHSGHRATTTGSNHLAGRIAGSIFRLTLASILADQLELVRSMLDTSTAPPSNG